MSLQWTAQRERGSRGSLRLIRWIGLRLGRPAARAFLYPITLYFLIKAKPQRLASRLYLTRALGRPATLFDIARHIHCFAATILDRVFLLSGRDRLLDIRLHNPECVLERIDSGRGFLLLGSHLGSFEAVRALAIGRRSLPLKVLMVPEHNQVITEILHALNPQAAETVIPLGTPESLLRVKESLDQGCMVGLLGDRSRPEEDTLACRFMGEPAPFPTGPMTLAAATRAPVVLFFGLYRGGNRYDVVFEPLTEGIAPERRQRAQAVEHWTRRYAERLEHHARHAPYNWFNFYDFWDETGIGPT
ncbi:LpxL/LpxP family acyltransferase [Imhoffiella purpurea]|uniref:Lysophospholipid acyltransferase n=1 Tax=Imhoffiella purpurea TaxID=1249627 RepID=W9V9F5_9GAMM|nr:lipid A biosynthesis acyltransferase [Imhoffiella purpurea]EXJ16233.1 Lysophospholipid acyltransferase [Imhoffiella purpurea]